MYERGEPDRQSLVDAFEAIAAADLRAEAGTLAQPALVVAGSRDTLTLPAAGKWLAGAMPDARFALIAGAAHVPFLSHPDAFYAALDPFLDGR